MIHIGFTGTARGMTERQWNAFRQYVLEASPAVFCHGDCIGADAQAHDAVRELVPTCRIFVYPANVASSKRAWKNGDRIFPPAAPLKRNKTIVHVTNVLVATPYTYDEMLRSGTWSTVRYARAYMKLQPSHGQKLLIINPDGTVRV